MKLWVCLITAVFAVSCFSGVCSATSRTAAPETDDISAEAAVLIEADSGRVIWGSNENKKLPMASTTKIMSVLLTLESGDLDSEFTVDPAAVNAEGSSMGLREGDIVSKRDLCIGMLLPSGNDAANCAAVKVGGSFEGFAKMMNDKAAELGLRSTHFVTPSGLHDDDHYSTAADMAHLAAYALDDPDFAEICGCESISLSYGNPPYHRRLYNTNKLLGTLEGCIGVKTGFTDEAGRCLVSAVRRNGVCLICVTLDAPDDWNDHKKLYSYGFDRVTRSAADVPCEFEIPVVGGMDDTVTLRCERKPEYSRIEGAKQNITWSASYPRFLYAPVTAEAASGELIIYDNGRETDRIKLYPSKDVISSGTAADAPEIGITDKIIDFIKNLLYNGKS